MKLFVSKTSDELGAKAAAFCADILRREIAEKGRARVILSTGASQFDTLKHLVLQDVDWSKVEMFHLDEYVGISDTHPASFRKYLRERFTSKVGVKAAYFVEGPECIKSLTEKLEEYPVCLGLIGIGENAHIAFNDPPADFNTRESYIVVKLAPRCRQQQLGEGWFKTIDDVPAEAVTMTPSRIMKCENIVSCVPYAVKAEAVRLTLETEETTNMVPSTLLKTHPNFFMFVDADSYPQG